MIAILLPQNSQVHLTFQIIGSFTVCRKPISIVRAFKGSNKNSDETQAANNYTQCPVSHSTILTSVRYQHYAAIFIIQRLTKPIVSTIIEKKSKVDIDDAPQHKNITGNSATKNNPSSTSWPSSVSGEAACPNLFTRWWTSRNRRRWTRRWVA